MSVCQTLVDEFAVISATKMETAAIRHALEQGTAFLRSQAAPTKTAGLESAFMTSFAEFNICEILQRFCIVSVIS